jgi:small subunit ribosomal protein S16
MLAIRLQRIGKNKFATYRLIVSEKARDTQGVYLEQLGTYNPHAKADQFKPVAERVTYWISKGAQASGTVHNLLMNAGIIKSKKKVKSVFLTKKRQAKVAEKKKAAA